MTFPKAWLLGFLSGLSEKEGSAIGCLNIMILHMLWSCSSKICLFYTSKNSFRSSKNILVLSGAGISVSCGIPDFRSSRGIYATLKQTFPDLPHPTAMFDIGYFKAKPQPFYSFAKVLVSFYKQKALLGTISRYI